MVNPSDAYSDIGDFQGGEAGWWFGKPEAGHPGLQQKLTDLGVEVIHRGTTPPADSEYAPEAGAAYYNETSEVLHLGDGTAWNAQATWGANPSFESASAESIDSVTDFNNEHYAHTPDQLVTQLAAPDASGGYYRLAPGTYGDSDISSTIHVDASTVENGATFTLDFTGSRIKPTSWDGSTFLQIGQSTVDVASFTVNIIGFNLDASAVPEANLGTGIETWNLAASKVSFNITGGGGFANPPGFDIGFHERSAGRSGHMNEFQGIVNGASTSVKIGDTGGANTVDRSFYHVQGTNYDFAACHVEKGAWNMLYVENERIANTATGPTYGYYIPDNGSDNHSNTIGIVERSEEIDDAYPLYILQPNTIIRVVGAGSDHLWHGSVWNVPPSNIHVNNYKTKELDFISDERSLFTITNNGTEYTIADSALDNYVGYNNFSGFDVKAGTTDGNETVVETPGSGSSPDSALYLKTKANIFNTNYHAEIGWQNSNSANAMFVADAAVDGNWHAMIRDPNATNGVAVDQNLGVSATNMGHDLALHLGKSDNTGAARQHWIIDGQVQATTNQDLPSIFSARVSPRIELAISGTPASAPRIFINKFGYGSF